MSLNKLINPINLDDTLITFICYGCGKYEKRLPGYDEDVPLNTKLIKYKCMCCCRENIYELRRIEYYDIQHNLLSIKKLLV